MPPPPLVESARPLPMRPSMLSSRGLVRVRVGARVRVRVRVRETTHEAEHVELERPG